MSIYVNGTLENSLSRTGSIDYSTGTEVLFGVRSSTAPGEYYAGAIDETAIWSTSLSATEVRNLYQRQAASFTGEFVSRVMDAFATGQSWSSLAWKTSLPFLKALPDATCGAPPCTHVSNETTADYSALVGSTGTLSDNNLMSGIIGLWHLDEASGTSGTGSIRDSSGKGNHLTPSGGVYFGQGGKFGSAARFDGSGILTSISNVGASGASSRSVAAWVRVDPASNADPGCLAGWGYNETVNHLFYLSTSLASTFHFGTWYYGNDVDSGVNSRDGMWHHLVNTYDGTTVRMYVDGVAKGTSTVTLVTDDVPFNIGAGHVSSGNSQTISTIDEVAAWSRALDPKEIAQLYRRGANRAKMQVRVCTAADCSDDASGANWKGPTGTNQSYFTELYNVSTPSAAPTGTVNAGSPTMTYSNFSAPVGTSRYFQYRTILETDDTSGTSCNYGSGATWCSPELKSASVGPVHYAATAPTIVGTVGHAYTSLASFTQTLGSNGCGSGVVYNFGVGASAAAATWYWWDPSAAAGVGAWATSDGTATQASSATTVNAHAGTFASQLTTGTVYFRAYLQSSGSTACEIDLLTLTGN